MNEGACLSAMNSAIGNYPLLQQRSNVVIFLEIEELR